MKSRLLGQLENQDSNINVHNINLLINNYNTVFEQPQIFEISPYLPAVRTFFSTFKDENVRATMSKHEQYETFIKLRGDMRGYYSTEVINKVRVDCNKLLMTYHTGTDSLSAFFERIPETKSAEKVYAASLSATYYQQYINPWYKTAQKVQEELNVDEVYRAALQKGYPSVKKHWDFIQSVFGGSQAASNFEEIYSRFRQAFGFSSVTSSITTTEERAFYDELKGIFDEVKTLRETPREATTPELDRDYRRLQAKFQECFVKRAIKQFTSAKEGKFENGTQITSLAAKRKILAHASAKLLAVLTYTDDGLNNGFLRGIPESWLGDKTKIDLLQDAKQCVLLSNHLAIDKASCDVIDGDYRDKVIATNVSERKKQEQAFFDSYLQAYQKARGRQTEFRVASLKLAYVCSVLQKPYLAEIEKFQNKYKDQAYQTVLTGPDGEATQSSLAQHTARAKRQENLILEVLQNYLHAKGNAKIRLQLQLNALLDLYQINYGSFEHSDLTPEILKALAKIPTITVVVDKPIQEAIQEDGTQATIGYHSTSVEIPAQLSEVELFNINSRFTCAEVNASTISSIEKPYRDFFGIEMDFLKQSLYRKYFYEAISAYEAAKAEFKKTLFPNDALRNKLNKCLGIALYRAEFYGNAFPEWKLSDDYEAITNENKKKKLPAGEFGLSKETLRAEQQRQRDIKANIAKCDANLAAFRAEAGEYAAHDGKSLQYLANALLLMDLTYKRISGQYPEGEKAVNEKIQSIITSMLDKIRNMESDKDGLDGIIELIAETTAYVDEEGAAKNLLGQLSNSYVTGVKKAREPLTAQVNSDAFNGQVELAEREYKAKGEYNFSLPNDALRTFICFILRFGNATQCKALADYFPSENYSIPLVYVEGGQFFTPVLQGVDWTVLPSEGPALTELKEVMQHLSAIFITINLLAEKAERFAQRMQQADFTFTAQDIADISASDRLIELNSEAETILDGIKGRTILSSFFNPNRDLAAELKEKLAAKLPAIIANSKEKWQVAADKLAQHIESSLYVREQDKLKILPQQLAHAKKFIADHASSPAMKDQFDNATDVMKFTLDSLLLHSEDYRTGEHFNLDKIADLFIFCKHYASDEQKQALIQLYFVLERPFLLRAPEQVQQLLPLFAGSEDKLYEFIKELGVCYPGFVASIRRNDRNKALLAKITDPEELASGTQADHDKAKEVQALVLEFLTKQPNKQQAFTLNATIAGKAVTQYQEVVDYFHWLVQYDDEVTKPLCAALKAPFLTYASACTGEPNSTYQELLRLSHRLGFEVAEDQLEPVVAGYVARLTYLYDHPEETYTETDSALKAVALQPQTKHKVLNKMRALLSAKVADDELLDLVNVIPNAAQRELATLYIYNFDTDQRRTKLMMAQIQYFIQQENAEKAYEKSADLLNHIVENYADDVESFLQLSAIKLTFNLSSAQSDKEFNVCYELCLNTKVKQAQCSAICLWLDRYLVNKPIGENIASLETILAKISSLYENGDLDEQSHRRLCHWLNAQNERDDIVREDVRNILDELTLTFGDIDQQSRLVIKQIKHCAETLSDRNALTDLGNIYNRVPEERRALVCVDIENWIQTLFDQNAPELHTNHAKFSGYYSAILTFGTEDHIYQVITRKLSQDLMADVQAEISDAERKDIIEDALTGVSENYKEVIALRLEDWLRHFNEKKLANNQTFNELIRRLQSETDDEILRFVSDNREELKAIDGDKKEFLSQQLKARALLEVRTYDGVITTAWNPLAQQIYNVLGFKQEKNHEFTNWVTLSLRHPEAIPACEKHAPTLFEANAKEFDEIVKTPSKIKKYGAINQRRMEAAANRFMRNLSLGASFVFSKVRAVTGHVKSFVENLFSFGRLFGQKVKVIVSMNHSVPPAPVHSKRKTQKTQPAPVVKQPTTHDEPLHPNAVDLIKNLAEDNVELAINAVRNLWETSAAENKDLLSQWDVNSKANLLVAGSHTYESLVIARTQIAEYVRGKCLTGKAEPENLKTLVDVGLPKYILNKDVIQDEHDKNQGKTAIRTNRKSDIALRQQLTDVIDHVKVHKATYEELSKLLNKIAAADLNQEAAVIELVQMTRERLEAMYLHLTNAQKLGLYAQVQTILIKIPATQELAKRLLTALADILNPACPVADRNIEHSYIARPLHQFDQLSVTLALVHKLRAYLSAPTEDEVTRLTTYIANISDADKAKYQANQAYFEPLIEELFAKCGVRIIEQLDKLGLTSPLQSERCAEVLAANKNAEELINILDNEKEWDTVAKSKARLPKLLATLTNVNKNADALHRAQLREKIKARFDTVIASIEAHNKVKSRKAAENQPVLNEVPTAGLELLKNLYLQVYKPHAGTSEKDELAAVVTATTTKTLSAVRTYFNLQDNWFKTCDVVVSERTAVENFALSASNFIGVFGSEADKREAYYRIVELNCQKYFEQASERVENNINNHAIYFKRLEKFLMKFLPEFPRQKFRQLRFNVDKEFEEIGAEKCAALPPLVELTTKYAECRDKIAYVLLDIVRAGLKEPAIDHFIFLRNELVRLGVSNIKKTQNQGLLSPESVSIAGELGSNYAARTVVKMSALHVNTIRYLQDPSNQTPEAFNKGLSAVIKSLEKHQLFLTLLANLEKMTVFVDILKEESKKDAQVKSLCDEVEAKVVKLRDAIAGIQPLAIVRDGKTQAEIESQKTQQQDNLREQVKKVDTLTQNALTEIVQLVASQPGFKKRWEDIPSTSVADIADCIQQLNHQKLLVTKYAEFLAENSEQSESQQTFGYKTKVAIEIEGPTKPALAVETLVKIATAAKGENRPLSLKQLDDKKLSADVLEASVGFSGEFFTPFLSTLEEMAKETRASSKLEKLPILIARSKGTVYFIVSTEQKEQLKTLAESLSSGSQHPLAAELVALARKAVTLPELANKNAAELIRYQVTRESVQHIENDIEKRHASLRITQALDNFLASKATGEFNVAPEILTQAGNLSEEQKAKLDAIIQCLQSTPAPLVSAAAADNLLLLVGTLAKDKEASLQKVFKSLAKQYAKSICQAFRKIKSETTLNSYFSKVNDLTSHQGEFAGQYSVLAKYGDEVSKEEILTELNASAEPYLRLMRAMISNPHQTLKEFLKAVNKDGVSATTLEMLGCDSGHLSKTIEGLQLLSKFRDKLRAFNRVSRQLFADVREQASQNDATRLINLENSFNTIDSIDHADRHSLAHIEEAIDDFVLNGDTFVRLRLAELLLDYVRETEKLQRDQDTCQSNNGREISFHENIANQVMAARHKVINVIRKYFPLDAHIQQFYFDACMETQRLSRTHKEAYPETAALTKVRVEAVDAKSKIANIEQRVKTLRSTVESLGYKGLTPTTGDLKQDMEAMLFDLNIEAIEKQLENNKNEIAANKKIIGDIQQKHESATGEARAKLFDEMSRFIERDFALIAREDELSTKQDQLISFMSRVDWNEITKSISQLKADHACFALLQNRVDEFGDKVYIEMWKKHNQRLSKEISTYYNAVNEALSNAAKYQTWDDPLADHALLENLEEKMTKVAMAYTHYIQKELKEYKDNPNNVAELDGIKAKIEEEFDSRLKKARSAKDFRVYRELISEITARINYCVAAKLGLYDRCGYTLLGTLTNAVATAQVERGSHPGKKTESIAVPGIVPKEERDTLAATFKEVVKHMEDPQDEEDAVQKQAVVIGTYLPSERTVWGEKMGIASNVWAVKIEEETASRARYERRFRG